jgi:hypothetical protein
MFGARWYSPVGHFEQKPQLSSSRSHRLWRSHTNLWRKWWACVAYAIREGLSFSGGGGGKETLRRPLGRWRVP